MDAIPVAAKTSLAASRCCRAGAKDGCYRPAACPQAASCHHRLPVADGYHHSAGFPPAVGGYYHHRRYPACPAARGRAGWAAASGAYSAAVGARAAVVADAAQAAGASDAAVEREAEAVAAAAADDESKYCAERTRVAQHSSGPNSPRR